jgi:hypothetical protein
MNLKSAREHFENLEKSSTGGGGPPGSDHKQLTTGR